MGGRMIGALAGAVAVLAACNSSHDPAAVAAPPSAPAPTTSSSTSIPATTGASAAPSSSEPPTTAAVETTTSEPSTRAEAPTTAEPAAATSDVAPAPGGSFTFEVSAITPELRARMVPTSWREGCPVALDALRYLRIGYWGFDGAAHVGELVAHADAVDALGVVFARLVAAGFPIRRMQLVDDYGGNDLTSIEADNTSAFNCRAATGSTNWSQHAYGRAIDVNPVENPYVEVDGSTSHPASVPYLDRSADRSGMATDGGVLVAAFEAVGWAWGGRWGGPVDYQHFSASGG